PEEACEIGGGTSTAWFASYAVKEPHGTFDEQKLCVLGVFACQVAKQFGRHSPAVEIEAGYAGSCFMKARVDVVWTGLDAANLDAAAGKGPQQADGDARLAGAGSRGTDD